MATHLRFISGDCARTAVERAREQVALALGAEDPSQIVFTSGATESNNWALGERRLWHRVAVSPFEHSSIAEIAERRAFDVLPTDGYLPLLPGSPVDGVSLMAVHNEFGTQFELKAYRDALPSGVGLHSDVTQALGKVPLSVEPLDLASVSAHKLYGPKGVGALYARSHFPDAMELGGGQELGLRSGTLNVSGIVGFGAAAELAIELREADAALAATCRQSVLHELAPVSGWTELSGQSVSPFILAIAFESVLGEALVVELDARGFAISAGAACSSGSTEPSPSVREIGLDDRFARGVIRISFGRFSSVEASESLAKALAQAVESLRKLSK